MRENSGPAAAGCCRLRLSRRTRGYA